MHVTQMTQRGKTTLSLALGIVLTLLVAAPSMMSAACAAGNAQIEDVALSVGELALAVDKAERAAFESGLYDAERHKVLGAQVLRLLYAARAFERAVAASDDAGSTLTELRGATSDLARAVADVPGLAAAVQSVSNLIGGIR